MRLRRHRKGVIMLMVVFLSAALFLSLSAAVQCHFTAHKFNLKQKQQLQQRVDDLWRQ